MTPKQVEQFNRMHNALTTITKKYQTVGQLRRSADTYCGLSFEEVMIGAYENIKSDAADAVRGVRRIASNPTDHQAPASGALVHPVVGPVLGDRESSPEYLKGG